MKLKLASLKQIIKNIKSTIWRFPLAMLAALAGTTIAIMIIHAYDEAVYVNLFLILLLAFPLFLGLSLFGEQRNWASGKKWFTNFAAVILLAVYYYWFTPENFFEAEGFYIIRHVMWILALIVMVSVVPFLQKNKGKIIAVFWHYGKILVFSLGLTLFWALALQAGLSIAMVSIDYLFHVDIDGDRYVELWFIIVGIFSTLFFLSRIPKEIINLRPITTYPKELRLFSQYVLVPLVSIYFLILYAYVVQILVLWEWPEGTLALMILGFSFLGVLTYVSLYPLRDKKSWLKIAGTLFFSVLIPQIGMLFWALWFRVSEYGLTENRYFVFIGGCWLLAMALYFLISKKKDIRLIPITLFTLMILASFGPWSAFAVAERNQINRLEKVLVKNDILVDGKVQKATETISDEDYDLINSALKYLNKIHGFDGIQPWFDQDLSKFGEKTETFYYRMKKYRTIMQELMGLESERQKEFSLMEDVEEEEEKYFYFHVRDLGLKPLIKISPFDYQFKFRELSGDIGEISNVNYRYELDSDNAEFVILKNEAAIARVDLNNFLKGFLEQEEHYLDQESMSLKFENENISLSIRFDSITGDTQENNVDYIGIAKGTLLFSLKN